MSSMGFAKAKVIAIAGKYNVLEMEGAIVRSFKMHDVTPVFGCAADMDGVGCAVSSSSALCAAVPAVPLADVCIVDLCDDMEVI